MVDGSDSLVYKHSINRLFIQTHINNINNNTMNTTINHTPAEIRLILNKRVNNIMAQFKCTRQYALIFIDFRNAGYSITAAALMAGISDPR